MPDADAPLLQLIDVTRRFPGVLALDGVSFDLAAGEVHALVGENGAGKSTLINIISGVLDRDSGQVRLAGSEVHWTGPLSARRAGIVAVHQEAELFGTLSVAENMALEQGLPVGPLGWVRWRAIHEKAAAAVQLLGEPIDVRQDASRLSIAQRHMTQIAAAVVQRARVLVLDEPTSALTAGETAWLFGQIARLKAQGVGIVYISHRQEEILQLADRITVLRDGRAVWSGPRAAIERADLIRHMVGRQRAGEMDSLPKRVGATVGAPRLQVEHLADPDGRFRDISFQANAGEVLGIYGLVGSGRSEVARAIFGLSSAGSGSIVVDGRPCAIASAPRAVAAKLAYLPEDRLRQGVFRGLSVRANAVLASLPMLGVGPLASARRERIATNAQIASLAVKCRGPEQPLGELSGGNQQKVVLARWLLTDPAVLLLDEPTRGVDISAKAEIHRILRRLADEGRAVVLISSDLPEVLDNSDRVVVFRGGRIVGHFDPRATTPEAIAAAALSDAPPRDVAPFLGHDDSRAAPGKRRGVWPTLRRRARNEAALAAALACLTLALGLSTDAFFTPANLWGLTAAAAPWVILSLAAAVIIMTGAIDISLGSLLALSAGVGGLILKLPWPPGATISLAVGAALAVGIGGGLMNASLALAGRVHPIVVTLGTMTVYRGLLVALTGGDTITDLPPEFVAWSNGRLLGVNGSVLLALATAVAVYVWIARTRSGRHLVAFGSSRSAARLLGISQARCWLLAFGGGGLLAALAGLLELSQTGALQSGMGSGYELRAIAAAVIGGVSVSGGRGSVLGVCLGALLLSLIHNGLVLWQVSPYQHALVTGALLLAAVLVDLAWRRLDQ